MSFVLLDIPSDEKILESNNFSSTDPTFWQPLSQLGRIADQQANATNCSSFIATIGSSGKVWVNSASRTTNASGQDIEYQSRFDLGEPDLTEGPAGSMTPPPKRLATQALTYGTVDSPGGGFHSIANTRDFTVQPIEIGVQ